MDSRLAVHSLAALAQESRLAIYRRLVEAGPSGLSVGEIGAALHVAPATLSFHLKELFHAGLVKSRQDGRYVYYFANYERMNALLAYLTENCCAQDGVGCEPDCCSPEAAESQPAGRSSRSARRTPSK